MASTLQRSLSLTGAVALTVGFVVGGSIFVLIPTLAGMTGPSLWLAYLLSAIPAVFAALYLMQLGGAMPVTGANYVAVTRWISPMAGFSTSLSAGVAMVCTNCLVAWGFAEYLVTYLPQLPVMACAVGVIVLFGLINWFGVRTFEKIQVVMLVVFMVAMLIFGIGGLFNIQPEFQTPMFPKGMGGFFTVVAVASFSWAGVIAIVEVSGEVRNPKRNVPLTIMISMVIIGLLYIIQTYAFTGTLLWSESAEIGSTAVLKAAGSFLPKWGVGFIALGALLAMATTINSMILMGARETLVWSSDLVIPAFFQRINPRFHTPEMTIFLMTALSVVGVLFAADIEKYALMVIFALMVIQFFGATAVLRMPGKAPDIYQKALFKFGPFWRWFTWIGCVVFFLGVFAFGILADYQTFLVFLGIWLISVVYWYARKAYLTSKGISLHEKLKAITQERLDELEDADEKK
ncbi:MAG: amino acid permease [Proteobacteria bacterium]|nr:amino acid permease [Pseudomonadota bacterium]